MNFLVFLRENAVVFCLYMFSIAIQAHDAEVAGHCSPQNSHSLNHHKVLLVNTSCWIFFSIKFKFSIQNPSANLLYQQAALLVNFIDVFTQLY